MSSTCSRAVSKQSAYPVPVLMPPLQRACMRATVIAYMEPQCSHLLFRPRRQQQHPARAQASQASSLQARLVWQAPRAWPLVLVLPLQLQRASLLHGHHLCKSRNNSTIFSKSKTEISNECCSFTVSLAFGGLLFIVALWEDPEDLSFGVCSRKKKGLEKKKKRRSCRYGRASIDGLKSGYIPRIKIPRYPIARKK